ncbi:S-layer family protein [Leptothoe sp. EHU-05/26/07-4]
MTGSFYATTATAVDVGEGVFSAVMPGQSQLLAVSPSVLFWNHLTDNSGDITNRGQVTAGADLVLAGQNLDLAAQVAGVGDVSLLATDIVKIRDTADNPFIALAGGDLLVQGNQHVDIVALTHPDSQLFSYGNMVLRSPEPVNGDAYFFSGGNFRIENLDNTPGNLNSPVDPIIRSLGDVEFDNYFGSSLHILAGGSVTFTSATITAPDPGIAGVDFLQETIELSDGTIVEVDGSAQPTIDIRAGVRPDAVGVIPAENPSGQGFLDLFVDSFFLPLTPSITANPSSADIEIGSITMGQSNGLVLITNLYEPNDQLSGDIQIVGNDPLGLGFSRIGISIIPIAGTGSSAFLESRGDIDIVGTSINTGNGGDITLVADDSVNLVGGNERLQLSGLFTSFVGQGEAGSINITAQNLSVVDGALIASETFGIGQNGNIVLNIEETVLFEGPNPVNRSPSGISTVLPSGSQGRGGDIQISAKNLLVLDGAQLDASTLGLGDAGDIILEIAETTRLEGISSVSGLPSSLRSRILSDAIGNAGNIQLKTRNLEVLNGASIETSNLGGVGDTGNITLNVRETARFDGFSDIVSIFFDGQTTQMNGDIRLTATNLEVLNGSAISTSVRSDDGFANAGNIFLNVRENITIAGQSQDSLLPFPSRVLTFVDPGASGRGGDINITSANLDLIGGVISASNTGTGDAGNILIVLQDTFRARNSDVGTTSESNAGGQIDILADNIFLFGDSDITSAVRSGVDDGGNITLVADALVAFDDSDILAFAADGRGGDIDLSRTAFFGEDFQFAQPGTDPNTLDGNGRVDINATGGIASGTISLADVSFIENSITELPDELVNPETLVAASCIAQSSDIGSSVVFTGNDSLPQQPDSTQTTYSLSTVQPITETATNSTSISEPQGLYRLADGRLVISRDCHD